MVWREHWMTALAPIVCVFSCVGCSAAQPSGQWAPSAHAPPVTSAATLPSTTASNVEDVPAEPIVPRTSPSATGSTSAFVLPSLPGAPASVTAPVAPAPFIAVGAVAIDLEGHVLVAGTFRGHLLGQVQSQGLDAFLLSLDPRDGHVVWVQRVGTSENDAAEGVAFDGEANVYVAGMTRGVFAGQSSSGGDDAFLGRHSARDGQLLWTKQFGTEGDDGALAVAVDARDRVLVAGVEARCEPDPYAEPGAPPESSVEDCSMSTEVSFVANPRELMGKSSVHSFSASGSLQWTQQMELEAGAAAALAIDVHPGAYVGVLTQGRLDDEGLFRVGYMDAADVSAVNVLDVKTGSLLRTTAVGVAPPSAHWRVGSQRVPVAAQYAARELSDIACSPTGDWLVVGWEPGGLVDGTCPAHDFPESYVASFGGAQGSLLWSDGSDFFSAQDPSRNVSSEARAITVASNRIFESGTVYDPSLEPELPLYVRAHRLATGKPLWTKRFNGSGQPKVAAGRAAELFVVSESQNEFALQVSRHDQATGKVSWTVQLPVKAPAAP